MLQNLGIKPEIIEELEGLKDRPMSNAYYLETAAWYNGREKGVSISVKRKSNTSTKHVFVLAEDRRTDGYVLYSWTPVNPLPINPPTPMDLSEEVYKNVKGFSTLTPARLHIVKELYNL